MQEHNPYAAPTAPVTDDSLSQNAFAQGEEHVEYGGFWRRVGAQVLDALILAPVGILAYFGAQLSRLFYLYYLVPSVLLALFYSVYLVKRYGGTPGKRILEMRIVMTDGSPVTTSAALVRYSVMLVFSTISSAGMAIAALRVSPDGYESLGFLERMAVMSSNTPPWSLYSSYLIWAWLVAGMIVMLCNRRRRATHDFMAKTLVVRT